MGLCGIIGGVCFVLFGPPATLSVVKLLGELSDRRLHKYIMALFRSLPSTLGATLYVSAEAGRCIIQASSSKSILSQCGNPLAPTFFVAVFLGTSWVIQTVIPYITPPRDLKWSSIAQLRMETHERQHLVLMTVFDTLTVVMYAFVYEDGDSLNAPLYVLGFLFLLVFILLVCLVVYEAVVIPILEGKLSLTTSGLEGSGDRGVEGRGERRHSEVTDKQRNRGDSDAFSWGGHSSGNLL